jgi:hypothetical protein
MGIVGFLIIVWIASLGPRQTEHPHLPRDRNEVVFYPIALRATTTTEAVIQYVAGLERQVDNLPRKGKSPEKGFLEYIPNQTMTQGVKEKVAATISLSRASLESVRAEVFKESHGAIKLDEIYVSQTMTARLTGSPSLEIQELSTPQQLIRPDDATVWYWNVTPTESGDAELYLILSLHIRAEDGTPAAKDLEPRIRKIKVRVNSGFALQKFFRDNLAAIVGILSIGTTMARVPWRRVWSWATRVSLGLLRRLRYGLRWLRRKWRRVLRRPGSSS